MPRPKPLPTPSASTDLAAAEKQDMEEALTLPPPASPPGSPNNKPQTSPRHKRTSSGAMKAKEDDHELPPPPSRARKIIQMKPKSASSSSASEYVPPKPAAGTKRKQPTATSAAGRKIARKTAHSIIERRRRSKMNEEFGVLKDMIPACEGVEMHKLAILQAGIEYVRYLEGCVRQLKGDKDEEEDEVPPKRSATASTTDWEYRKPSMASSSSGDPSPDIAPQRPQQHRPVLPSIPSFTASPTPPSHSATPTPTLLSPAFNAIQFSPDLARTSTNSTSTNLSIHNASPNILPLPKALMDLNRNSNKSPMSEGGAEATATAALMMLTNDRRGETGRGKGMSVRELLAS